LPECDPGGQCDYCKEAGERVRGSNGLSLNVVDIKDEDWGGPEKGDKHIDKRLMCLFKDMQEAAKKSDPSVHLKVVSGFRTLDRQKFLRERAQCEGDPETCANGPWVEKPGESDHFSGIAIDILTNCNKCKTGCQKDKPPDGKPCNTKEMDWLKEKAGKFDLINDIKGSPGHFRYHKPLSSAAPSVKTPSPAKISTPVKTPSPAKISTPVKTPSPAKISTPAKTPSPASSSIKIPQVSSHSVVPPKFKELILPTCKRNVKEWARCTTYARTYRTCENECEKGRLYDACEPVPEFYEGVCGASLETKCCNTIKWWEEEVECCCVHANEKHRVNVDVTKACKHWAKTHREKAQELKAAERPFEAIFSF